MQLKNMKTLTVTKRWFCGIGIIGDGIATTIKGIKGMMENIYRQIIRIRIRNTMRI